MNFKSLVAWLLVNLATLAFINFVIWRQAGKKLPKTEPISTTARAAAKFSFLLTANAWIIGIVFEKLARELSGIAGVHSPWEFMAWQGDQRAVFVSLLLLAELSPLLVVLSIPFGIVGFLIGKRKSDVLAKRISLVAIVLNTALIVYGCASLAGVFDEPDNNQEHRSSRSSLAAPKNALPR